MPEVSIEQAMQIALELHQSGRLAEAESIYRQILARDPNHAEAIQLLGVIALAAGQFPLAVDLITRAIELQPNRSHYHNNRASALQRLGQNDEAILSYHRAVELDPASFDAIHNLADLLSDVGRFDESIVHYFRAIALQPEQASVRNNLGNVLFNVGKHAQAIAQFRRALALQPDLFQAHCNLGNALLETGHPREALAAYRESLRLNPDQPHVQSNALYAMHFDSAIDRQTLFQQHLKWASQHASPLSREIQPHTNDRSPDRKLRIAYISQDFRDHPVGRLILPLFQHHDRTSFEVHAFSDVLIEDQTTARLRGHADHWHRIAGLAPEVVAQKIRDAQIDILIDLTGHAGVGRLLALARKPAPIQVTYLGYPDTTGLATVDYRLTDAIADPPGESDALHTERLIRLPHGFLAFTADDLPPVAPLPALQNGFVTFGSFNNFAKVSPETVELWSKILAAVPNAHLAIKASAMGDPETRDDARKRLLDLCIPADRLKILERSASHRDHLATYAQIDIALDTFPYNGTTTTLEALAMGVPVIALAGKNHAGRMGASLLTQANHPEWIAQTSADYIRIAVDLASNIPHLAANRLRLRDELLNSPIGDAPRLTREIESAFRQMWETACDTKNRQLT